MFKTILLLLAVSHVANAQQSITRQQITAIQSDGTDTSITYSFSKSIGKQVLIAAGGCTIIEDPTLKIKTAVLFTVKCVEDIEQESVTIDPPGLFNQKTYLIEDSQRNLGVRKVTAKETVSTDMSKLFNETSGDILSEVTRNMNLSSQCEAVNRSMENQFHYSESEKSMIVECLGLD